MVPNYITIVSMNCQGLSNQEKRSDTLNFLKCKKHSIYFQQDTHFTTKKEKYIRTQWAFECYSSNFSRQAKGVAILFHNNFEFKVLKTVRDESGSKLILEVIIEGKMLTLMIGLDSYSRQAFIYLDPILIYISL